MEILLKESSSIIKDVANTLKNNYVPIARALDRKALLEQFETANSFAQKEIKRRLFDIAPHIFWSDAEFDMGKQKTSRPETAYWICDAIDGAVHFLQDFSPWCITLTLMQNNQPAFAIIYDAVRDDCLQRSS